MVHDYRSVNGNYGFGSYITVECYTHGTFDDTNESVTSTVYITINGKERNRKFVEAMRIRYDDDEYSRICIQEMAGYRRRYYFKRFYNPVYWTSEQFTAYFNEFLGKYGRYSDWMHRTYEVQDGGYIRNVTFIFEQVVDEVMDILKDARLINDAN